MARQLPLLINRKQQRLLMSQCCSIQLSKLKCSFLYHSWMFAVHAYLASASLNSELRFLFVTFSPLISVVFSLFNKLSPRSLPTHASLTHRSINSYTIHPHRYSLPVPLSCCSFIGTGFANRIGFSDKSCPSIRPVSCTSPTHLVVLTNWLSSRLRRTRPAVVGYLLEGVTFPHHLRSQSC